MIAEDFLESLLPRFGPKKSEEQRKQFQDDIMFFTSRCPEPHLKSVHDYFLGGGGYPNRKNLFKYARSNGWIKDEEFPDSSKPTFYYSCNGFYKKYIEEVKKVTATKNGFKKETEKIEKRAHVSCNTKYTINSGGCPNCGSTSGTVVDYKGSLPVSTKIIQTDCFRCKLYAPEDGLNRIYLYGPECGEYGGRDSPKTEQTCKSCDCQACCRDSRNYRFENEKYMDNVRNPNGEEVQGWIKDSRKPGETIMDVKKLSMKLIKRG